MADVELKLAGFDDAIGMLNEFAADMRNKVVLGALRDAGKPVAKAAQALAAKHDFGSSRRVAGTMRRAIGVYKSKLYKLSNGSLGVYIKVRASKAQRRRSPITGDPFYARFVIGGHKTRPTTTGRSRRQNATAFVKGDDFLGDAFKQQGPNALAIFEQRIIARVAKANARK
jgi:hypothetical protein